MRDARALVWKLFVGGTVMSILGSIVIVAGWPGTEVDQVYGTEAITETGSWVVVAIGSALAFAGQSMYWVGVIGFGVRLGREAADVGQDASKL